MDRKLWHDAGYRYPKCVTYEAALENAPWDARYEVIPVGVSSPAGGYEYFDRAAWVPGRLSGASVTGSCVRRRLRTSTSSTPTSVVADPYAAHRAKLKKAGIDVDGEIRIDDPTANQRVDIFGPDMSEP